MSVAKEAYFKYVPHGFVHVWERAGWVSLPHVLNGTGHGEFSMYMQWKGEGQPICPPMDAVA